MAAMRLEQVQRFILAKKYFGVRGTLRLFWENEVFSFFSLNSVIVICILVFVIR